MNAAAPAPTELIQQWMPRLRTIARSTGCELADVRQQAWLLAAAGVKNPESDDFVPRWLVAVERHARAQAPGRCGVFDVREEAGGDDPEAILLALESLGAAIAGLSLDDVIAQPVTAREIAAATGRSERHGRRIKKQLDEVRAVQRDLFAVLFGDDESEVSE